MEYSFSFLFEIFEFYFIEREEHFGGWKKAVIKSFERLTPPFNIENKGKNFLRMIIM